MNYKRFQLFVVAWLVLSAATGTAIPPKEDKPKPPPLPSFAPSDDELPGYPEDVLPKLAQYECTQVTNPAKSPEKSERLVNFSVCADKNFGANGAGFVHRAVTTFQRRLMDPKVFDCIHSHTTLRAGEKRLESHAALLAVSADAAFTERGKKQLLFSASSAAAVFVSAMEAGEKTNPFYGEGYTNAYWSPRFSAENEGMRHLSIGIRKDLIGEQKSPFGGDADFWTAVVAVAAFKNLGLLPVRSDRVSEEAAVVGACFRWNANIPNNHAWSVRAVKP